MLKKKERWEKEDMKKIKKIFAMMLLIVMAVTTVPVPAQAAGKQKAVKVIYKREYKNDKEFMTVKGLNSKKKVVWKYTTKKHTATELDQTGCVRRNSKNKVYIFDGRKIVLKRKTDGKTLWTATASPAGHIYKFDKKENLYITGFYDTNVYKISAKGKRIWRTNMSKTGNYWPYKIIASDEKVTVLYEKNEKDTGSGKKHNVVFSAKTGKILKK